MPKRPKYAREMVYMYETKRLILRNWIDTDIPEFIKMNQDPKVMEFFPGPYSPEETIQSINNFKRSIEGHGYGMFACELKEDGQFIGFVGLLYRDFEASFTPCVEIGWRIAHKHWGKGLAVEAAYKCLEIGFNEFDLDEIISFTASINQRSERVMQKLGMSRDHTNDFYHPKLEPKHPLAWHILYRLSKNDFIKSQT